MGRKLVLGTGLLVALVVVASMVGVFTLGIYFWDIVVWTAVHFVKLMWWSIRATGMLVNVGQVVLLMAVVAAGVMVARSLTKRLVNTRG